MSFNDNDFKGFSSQQLKVFCHQVAETKNTPDLVSLVAGQVDYVNYCRKITNSDGQSREMFASFCRKNGFDPNEIQIRVCLVATVLGVYKQADYYGILGIAPDADEATIKKAYRKKAKILHPDKCDGDVKRSDEFIELHAAYSHLSDPELRKVYDAKPEVNDSWGKQVHTPRPSNGPAAVRRGVRWFHLLVGGIVIATSGFYVYQFKSSKFSSQTSTEASLAPSGAQKKKDVSAKIHFADELTASETSAERSADVEKLPDSDQRKTLLDNDDGGVFDSQNSSIPESANPSFAVKTAKESFEKTVEGVNSPKVNKDATVKPSKRTRKIGLKSLTKPRAKSKANKSTKPGDVQRKNDDIDPTVFAVQKERVISFLKNYTKTYEEGDLNKFRAFFTDNAMEQGQPFKKLLPTYKKTFNRVQFLEYKIDLKSLSMKEGGYKIIIDGKFKAKYRMANKRKGSNSGSIRMELLHEPDGLLVSRMDYEIGG